METIKKSKLRPDIDYENKCHRFCIDKKKSLKQYFSFYKARVDSMYELVKMRAIHLWGDDCKFYLMNELDNLPEGTKVCLIGIILKHLAKHPSILNEVNEDRPFEIIEEENKYIGDDDYLMLQQGKDTVRLSGNINPNDFVNGIVVALLGSSDEDVNVFEVEEYCFAGPIACIDRKIPEQNQFVVIVSGLGFSKNMPSDLKESLNFLKDYLIGYTNEEDSEEASQFIKLIIAGNCISKKVRIIDNQNSNNEWQKKEEASSTGIMQLVDNYLSEISNHVEIDIMPGDLDPASVFLPQQPFHVGILPKCSVMKKTRFLTNPYAAKINGTYFIGCSGQTIDSIKAYSGFDETLDILKQKINWGHLAPTAPDSLNSYPFEDKDPFIIDECPHVLFAGNQEIFNTQKMKNQDKEILLVSIPTFEDQKSCILVNLKNLKCDFMAFN